MCPAWGSRSPASKSPRAEHAFETARTEFGLRAGDEKPDFHFKIKPKKTRKVSAWVCEGDRPATYDAWSGKRNYPYPGKALRVVASKRKITNTTRKILTVYAWCNER